MPVWTIIESNASIAGMLWEALAIMPRVEVKCFQKVDEILENFDFEVLVVAGNPWGVPENSIQFDVLKM